MHIFLTGLTGFVGGYIVTELVRRGHRVTALVRDPAKASERYRDLSAAGLSSAALKLKRGDLSSVELLRDAMVGCDAVLHLAGVISALGLDAFRQVNRDGTSRILEAAALQHRRPRVLLVSSLAAAGPSQRGRPRREEDPLAPISWYGLSKREGEIEAERRAEELGITIVRPPAVYGGGDRATLAFFKMAESGRALFPGDPAIELSLIHVEDLARGLALALEADLPSGRAYFLGGAGAPSFAEVITTIAGALGRSARVRRVPSTISWCAAVAGEWNARLRGRAPELTRDKLKELGASGWACDSSRARTEFGFKPEVDWPAGLARTAEWYGQAGWLRRAIR